MNGKEDKRAAGGEPGGRYRLELVGLAPGAERPDLAVQALAADGSVLVAQRIDAEGGFAVPADRLKDADRILVGAPDDKDGIRREAALSYSVEEFRAAAPQGVLALAEPIWSRYLHYWTCVSGSVTACRRRPWWYETLVAAANAPIFATRLQARTAAIAEPAAAYSVGELLTWPVRCAPVCRGTVEVYRRTCCCDWLVIDEWRIADLIRQIERLKPRHPKPRIPKVPPPPPPPLGDPLATAYFKGGALNELALNAEADLQHLRALPVPEAAKYIEARPYLHHRLCRCGAPVRVGSGPLQDDGSFSICWIDRFRIFRPNCYDQYAYVVTQTIGATTTTIYDGLTAGAWFGSGDQPNLVTYDPRAYSCAQTGDEDGDAYVFLDLIGETESHELITPAASGWDRVAYAPPLPGATETAGLLFPVEGASGHLRNLGGAIELTFIFSLGLRSMPTPAHYYRVSVIEADGGDPKPGATRHYLGGGLSWQKIVGADIVPESLGPSTVNGVSNLYRIPYGDEPWVGAGRYHAVINTLDPDFNLPAATLPPTYPAAVRHLVTLEIFDVDGNRLRPLGTPAIDPAPTETTAPFEFRRWFQPGGSVGDDTVNVPHAALTHMFCWDNRLPVADISRLVMDGLPSGDECQFLEGSRSSTFGIEYAAYVPDQRFQYAHAISWTRGLNPPPAGTGTLPTPLSPQNVGLPPAAPALSGTNSFAQMLATDAPPPDDVLPRCSFAVTLTTYAKTTDGANLTYPFRSETAAFALAIAAPVEP